MPKPASVNPHRSPNTAPQQTENPTRSAAKPGNKTHEFEVFTGNKAVDAVLNVVLLIIKGIGIAFAVGSHGYDKNIDPKANTFTLVNSSNAGAYLR